MGCCGGNNQVDVAYHGNTNVVTVRSISVCEQLPVDVLRQWKFKVDCLIDNHAELHITNNPETVLNAQEVLNNWIAAKEEDPATCSYYEYLPLIQDIVNRCVIKGMCI